MLIDMIHDNHGEPPFKTRFRDPALLGRYGYQALVIPDALAALPSAYFDGAAESAASPTTSNARRPAELEAAIDLRVQDAVAAGLQVFFYGDALLLPRSVVHKRPAAFVCDDHSGRLCPGKPAVFEALGDLVGELFDRWPQAAGLVMRTGEVYPEATPHMVGSPLHATTCPSCRHLSLIDRLVNFIQLMHDVVIVELGRTYVHRAWQPAVAGLPNMHDDPTVYRTIADRLPRSERLCMSFKFTRGDFRAAGGGGAGGAEGSGYAFNACLNADDRPKWIELQCEREFEGKGAFPNFQAPLWKAFLRHLNPKIPLAADPETPVIVDPDAPKIADPETALPARFSLWGWSRGGGWGGPYIQREEWLDANVYALAQLYQNPAADSRDIATAWTSLSFGVPESAPPTPAIVELLALSPTAIRKLLYCAALPDDSIAPWVRDDLLDVNALWAAALRVVDLERADAACEEKTQALQMVDRMRQVWGIAQPELPNKSQVRDLTSSLLYFASFAGAVAHCFCGFVRFVQWSRGGRSDAQLARAAADHLETAQDQWHNHTQRHALLPGAPSVFHENTFWQRTNDCREQLAAAPA